MVEHCLGKMRVLEVNPSVALQPFVEKYYLYEHVDELLKRQFFRALPNGKVEIFILFNSSRVIFIGNRQRVALSAFIAGIFDLDHPMKVKVETPGHLLNGASVVLTHLGVNQILGVRLCDLTNKVLEMESFWKPGERWFDNIMPGIVDYRQGPDHLNDFLLRQVKVNDRPVQRIHWILNRLEHIKGPLTVYRVAGELNLSYKSLYRIFVEDMGLTPKMYLRILRFNLACWLLNRKPSLGWGDLVDRCGYYDQSHFIHEFKAIMRQSPLQYLKSNQGSFYLNRPYVFR